VTGIGASGKAGNGKTWLRVAVCGKTGFIIATRFQTALVVGKTQKFSADGELAQWCAWLWPQAGVHPGQTRRFPVTGPLSDVSAAIKRHYEEHGKWWA